MDFSVTLTRSISQRTSDEVVKKYIDQILRRALKGAKSRGWESLVHRAVAPTKSSAGLWQFVRKITFKKTGGRINKAPAQWALICKALIRAGQATGFNKYPWIVTGSGAEKYYEELATEGKVAPIAADDTSGKRPAIVTKPVKDFGEINLDMSGHFDHIYDRTHQIRILHSAIVAAKESNFINRFNCVLYGPPGCGKSDILISTGRMLGPENEAFMKLDATSTTEAGAQRILLEAAYVPPVLIVEEIEKTDEKSLRWLLGILDQRAEIRKTNFNIGHKARNVKMLCLATVNDIDLFKRVMSGALHSRFAHEIHCPRPNRGVMQRILEREVRKVKGDEAWIEPALKFCMDDMGWDDPRKIVPVCLCGRNSLLDGSYQTSLLQTMPEKNRPKGK